MRNRLLFSGTLCGALMLGGCAGMSDTEQRTLSGAAIGTGAGAIVSAATGEWGWAAGGAAVGAATGYLYDRQKKKEQQAYERGRRDAQAN
jgi:hypothetical protein